MDVRVRMTALLLLVPAAALAQSPKAATYITDEQVKAVNALPGIDRQLVSVDIGKLNLAVRRSAADSEVTKVLNGPSCSGRIEGADVVRKVVKTGDIVIIPAGVPHGWVDITDHVDYLSVRPDPDRVLAAGYVNPALRK